MAKPWVSKWDPPSPFFFVGLIEHQFFNQYKDPKPDLYGRYIYDFIGVTSSTRKEPTQLITAVISFHSALNIHGKFPTLLWLS